MLPLARLILIMLMQTMILITLIFHKKRKNNIKHSIRAGLLITNNLCFTSQNM